MNLNFINQSITRCNLTSEELKERGKFIRSNVISMYDSYKEIETGYTFTYKNTNENAQLLLDFIQAEGLCCSFIDFDLSFRPSEKKIICKVSTTTRDSAEFKKGIAQFYAMN